VALTLSSDNFKNIPYKSLFVLVDLGVLTRLLPGSLTFFLPQPTIFSLFGSQGTALLFVIGPLNDAVYRVQSTIVVLLLSRTDL
jgi:hypothetical protein